MTYGWETSCLRCGGTNDRDHVISSTPEVEAKALALADHLAPLCQDRGRMLGVMEADGEWIVCLSGSASIFQEFVNAVLAFDPHMSPIAHSWVTVPKRTLGGHDIQKLLRPEGKGVTWERGLMVQETGPTRVSLPIAGGEGCWCAAPKIISYLTQDVGAQLLPPKEMALIELWCGKAVGERRHKQLAASCDNCRRILPTLMCRSAAKG